MLKNQDLIFRMSLGQRIKLITSVRRYENCSVDDYEFPVFRFSADPSMQTAEKYATLFPSDRALAATWNPSLACSVYECKSNEAKANTPLAYFNVTNSLKKETMSEDYFLSAKMLAEKVKGVLRGGACVNFDDSPSTDDEIILKECVKLITDGVLSEVAPDSVRVNNADDAKEVPLNYRYKGLVYGVADTPEEVAIYISRGATLVFLSSNFVDAAESYLVEITKAFVKSREEYEQGKIPLSEFDRRIADGEALDEEAVNAACDRLIDLLLSLKNRNEHSVDEPKTSLEKVHTHEPLFDEIYHDKLARRAAQQSIVLLKNDGVLPLARDTEVAVIGEYASNIDYHTYNDVKPTNVRLPFDEITNYPLNGVGYAHGYMRGEPGRSDLIATARAICAGARYAIVYLSAEMGAKALPAEQLELLHSLTSTGVKVIAVVSADAAIDMAFADDCCAVLFTYRGGQGANTAVFDIITGEVCPSGKLVETFLKSDDADLEASGLPAYCMATSSNIRYPFGYGLSYTTFEYSNLKVNDAGVSLTVKNMGSCDGYATVQMYVQCVGGTSTLSRCPLRGFAKVFVKCKDAVKVEIPFDNATFRSFDKESNHYAIEGGNYRVIICDGDVVKLSGELSLKKHIFRDEVQLEKREQKPDMPVGFTPTSLDKAIRREKKKLSFGVKLFLAIVIAVYYNVMCAGLLLSNFINHKTMPLYIVLGALLLAGNALAIIYISVISKRRKLQRYMQPNEVLSDMVERVSEFEEVAKIVYNKPVEMPVIDFDAIKEAEEEQQEEERVRRYDATFTSSDEDVSFSQKVSFGEMCTNLREFALKKGVSIEPSTVRALLAALCSGKVVFLSCKNKEVLPDFEKTLCDYFAITGKATAADDWGSAENLFWHTDSEDGDYVLSDFSNALNSASNTPEKNCVFLIGNVSLKNLDSYFSTFIDYANFPSEKHSVTLNDDVSFDLPKNMCFILVLKDDVITEDISPMLAHAGILVDAIVSKADAPAPAVTPEGEEAEEVTAKTLPRAVWDELISEAREHFFIDEKVWKKLDELVEAISVNERFTIDNKSLLQLEKYTSVLLDCGGDEPEAVVNMFTAKIILLLKTTKAYRKEKGGLTLYGMIEKLFGDENLGAIQRALLNA